MSILRNRDAAEDATHEAFVKAAQRIDQLRDPTKLKSWLFSIARNEAIGETRRARRTTSEAVDVPSDIGQTPDERAESADLVRLVWDASEGLDERDREVLELTVRHGLNADEVAETLGLRTDHVHVLNHRLRKRTGVALGALMVARLGRRDCPELALVLKNWSGTYSPSIRRTVLRHIEQCDVCEKRRAGLVSPLALMAAVPLAKPAAALRARVLASYESSRVPVTSSGSRYRLPLRAAMSVAAVFTAMVAVMGLRALEAGDGSSTPAAADTPIATSARPEPITSTTPVGRERSRSTGADPSSESTAPAIPVAPSAPSSEPHQIPNDPTGDTQASVATDPSLPASSLSPTTSVEPPPVAIGPKLKLNAALVDLGHDKSSGTFSFENAGDEPADWAAAGAGLGISELHGTLESGATKTITVTVDRVAMSEGSFTKQVYITSSGGNLGVDVVGTVRHSPEVSDVRILDPTLHVSTACGSTQTAVYASVVDESDVVVEVKVRLDGAVVSNVAMQHVGGSLYTASVGPLPAAGRYTADVVASDSLNATASAHAGEIEVYVCLTGTPDDPVPGIGVPLAANRVG